jgi:hypothetical protein
MKNTKKKNQSQPTRKNSFLLLELLIALTLVAAILLPLVGTFTRIRGAEIKKMESCASLRLFRVALCDIKEKIFEGEIELKTGNNGAATGALYSIVSIEDHPKKKCSLCEIEVTLTGTKTTQRRTFMIYAERA